MREKTIDNNRFARKYECKQYKDLKLYNLFDVLDFAHYTYIKGMCSCCHTPEDFPSVYWKNGRKTKNPKFILFKNAVNGCGEVNRDDFIVQDFIGYKNLDKKTMDNVVQYLESILGDSYSVIKPADELTCIKIRHKNY